jgi:hypothetical protein
LNLAVEKEKQKTTGLLQERGSLTKSSSNGNGGSKVSRGRSCRNKQHTLQEHLRGVPRVVALSLTPELHQDADDVARGLVEHAAGVAEAAQKEAATWKDRATHQMNRMAQFEHKVGSPV